MKGRDADMKKILLTTPVLTLIITAVLALVENVAGFVVGIIPLGMGGDCIFGWKCRDVFFSRDSCRRVGRRELGSDIQHYRLPYRILCQDADPAPCSRQKA